MKKTVLVCCIALMTLAGLYIKGKVNTSSLIIDEDGTLTGVIDKKTLKGKLKLPSEVKKIGKGALSGCTGLTSIDFSDRTSLTKIDDYAFSGCTGLQEVRLPASLTQINGNVFTDCSNLHTVTVDPANKTYCTKDKVLYTKDMKTLVYAARNIAHISIPDTVAEIGNLAFYEHTGLTTVDLSSCTNLTEIGRAAFAGCTDLTEVDFSVCTNLREICNDTFGHCTSLTTVSLPASLTELRGSAFFGCNNLHTLIIDPANTTYCNKDNVIYTKDKRKLIYVVGDITHISIPNTVTEISTYAFAGCTGLTSIDLSICTYLTKIDPGAFAHCTGLTKVILPANLTKIGVEAFTDISPDALFTVPTEAVKELVINSVSGIKDEQITVKK